MKKNILSEEPFMWIVSTILVFATALSLVKLLAGTSTMPFWDHWHIINSYKAYTQYGFDISDFLKPHNDHRILPSKIIFFLDLHFFHGRNYFLYLCNYLLSCTVFFLLLWPLTRNSTVFRPIRRPHIICISLFLGLHIVSAKNLNWAFQSQFFFAEVFLIGGLSLLWAQKNREGLTVILFLATMLTWLSVFSFANGLISPLIFLAGLISLRQSKKKIIFTLMSFCVCYALFFHNYEFYGSNSDSFSFDLFRNMVAVFFFFLTSSVQEYLSLPFRAFIVFLSFIPLVISAIFAFNKEKPISEAIFLSLGAALFCGFSAAVTAFGRASMGEPHFIGLVPRYASVSLLYWTAVIVSSGFLMARFLDSRRPAWFGKVSNLLFGVISLMGLTIMLVDYPRYHSVYMQMIRIAQSSEEVIDLRKRELLTDFSIKKLHPKPDFVAPLIDFLVENNLGGFRTKNMTIEYEKAEGLQLTSCRPSGVDEVYKEKGESGYIFHAKGWAFTGVANEIHDIAIVDKGEASFLSGYASVFSRDDIQKATNALSDDHGFFFVLNMSRDSDSLNVVFRNKESEVSCSMTVEF